MAQSRDVLPSGSHFAATIATDEFNPEPLARVQQSYRDHGEILQFRTKAQAEQFFEGLELLEPEVVQMHKWRPDPLEVGTVRDADIAM